jgi:hypothetical protein
MMRRRFNRTRAAFVCVAIAASLAACSSGSAGSSTPTPTGSPPQDTSVIAATTRMICASEVQEDLRAALGASPVHPVVASWMNEIYACDYTYRAGAFVLSVKQLPDAAATELYFAHLGVQLGRTKRLDGIGQGAFAAKDGSVVVEKDDKVLLVDVRRLPSQFGVPADTPANTAITIAATIMGCWTGA